MGGQSADGGSTAATVGGGSGGGDRIKVGGDILQYEDFFVPAGQLAYQPEAFRKRLIEARAAYGLLEEFADRLAVQEDFRAESLETLLHQFVEEKGIKVADIIHALRVAVTGKTVGFGMFDTLAILGREEVLARIRRALEAAASGVIPAPQRI